MLAGSRDLLEVHGNARRIYCPSCGRTEVLTMQGWKDFSIRCICGGIKRPDLVLFGEQLPEEPIREAFQKAYEGVNIIVIGTSGVVQPVASIPFIAKANNGKMVEINPQKTELTSLCTDVHIKAKATVGARALELAMEESFS
jgi:NAD-dependent deacetylase